MLAEMMQFYPRIWFSVAVSNTVATNTSDNTHVYLAVNPHWTFIFVSVT